jgi:predicted nucleotidyltransferase
MTIQIVKMEFGSHMYGTNLPSSDRDYKGIFIPDPKEIILGRGKQTITTSTNLIPSSKNSEEDTDLELFSLKQYLKLLLEGQTVALTMLFCPKKNLIQTSETWECLQLHKDRWLHKGVSAFAGYCRQQANKYGIKGSRVAASRHAMEFFNFLAPTSKLHESWEGIKLAFTGMEHCEFIEEPIRGSEKSVRMLSVCNKKVQENVTAKEAAKIYTHLFNEYGQRALAAEKQENVDWKALMHAVRVAAEAYELLTTHHITYPSPNRELLLQIRKGELSYQAVAEIIEEGLLQLERAQEISNLPEKPDYEFAEDFIYRSYLSSVLKHIAATS